MATHAINDLAAHAFELVNKELAGTLDAARAELEGYVDGRAGPDALLRTAEHLHAARGALKQVSRDQIIHMAFDDLVKDPIGKALGIY